MNKYKCKIFKNSKESVLKIIVLFSFLLFWSLVPSLHAEVLFYCDFNDNTTGTYDNNNEILDDWEGNGFLKLKGGIEYYPRTKSNGTIISGAEAYEGKSLRVKFPKGATGGSSGWDLMAYMSTQYDELYYSFWIKWWPDVENPEDWAMGGKVGGGLAGGGWQSGGGTKPDGTDGWSGRTTFYGGDRKGQPYSYVYHQDQPTQYGEALRWDDGVNGQVYFNPGTWQHCEIYYKINTPGKYDGVIRVWFDGVLAAERTNYRFRDAGQTWAIDRLMLSNFYGGSVPSDKDEYVYFDNFIISTHRVGPGEPTYPELSPPSNLTVIP